LWLPGQLHQRSCHETTSTHRLRRYPCQAWVVGFQSVHVVRTSIQRMWTELQKLKEWTEALVYFFSNEVIFIRIYICTILTATPLILNLKPFDFLLWLISTLASCGM
jgi:hypothetical protein